MNKKLYVGGISWDTTEDGLKEAFAQAGPVVSAEIKLDRETGRSRGFGFVEMETEEAAQAAIKMWNDKELDGRVLMVNEARPEADRSAGGFGGQRGGYQSQGGNQRGGYQSRGGGRRY